MRSDQEPADTSAKSDFNSNTNRDHFELTPIPAAGVLPDRGDISPGSHLPLKGDLTFIGRENDLLALAAILLPSSAPDNHSFSNHGAAIISGGLSEPVLGGSGKTALAMEFCARYGRCFQSVHWINAARGEIEVEIARSGTALGLQNWSNKTAEQARQTYTTWAEGKLHLIVVDDPIYPAAVGPLLNSLPENVRVLVTSRQSGWQGKLGLVEHCLDVLTPQEGRLLTQNMAPRLENESADSLDELGERLGWLPLTLKLAGGCINEQPGLTLKTLFETLPGNDGDAMLSVLFDLCWKQVATDEDPTLIQVLAACSWLAPNEPLPLDVLSSAFGVQTSTILKHLSYLGLLGRDEANHYFIHPRIAELAQKQLGETTVNKALGAVANEMVNTSHTLAHPSDILPYRVHLEYLAEAAERRKLNIATALYSEAGYYQRMFAEFERARTSLGKALILIENSSGIENAEYTENLNNLGIVLHKLGNHEGAKKCFEQAILMDQKIHGKDDPTVATGHNNLGQVLLDMNNPQGAILHLEKAIEINEKELCPEHPLVASSYYNIGIILHGIGDLPRAKTVLERVLAVRKTVLGDSHADVAQSHQGLGMVLQTIGNLTDAQTHYEQAINIWEAVLGPDNLQSADARTSLAGVLHVTGNPTDAKTHYERALRIYQAALPPGNSNIRDVQLQLELLNQGLTYPQLLEKMEAEEDLPESILGLLGDMFGNSNPL